MYTSLSYFYLVIIFLLQLQQMLTQESQGNHNNSKIDKIIQVGHSHVDHNVREKVKEKLTQDAQFLLEKKRRQQEKKQRIKKMQQNFEKQRQLKVKAMLDKSAKTQEVLQKNKDQQNKKFKRKSDQFNKIISKIGHQNHQQIQKALHLQKQLEQSKHNKSMSRTEKSNILLKTTRSNSIGTSSGNVDEKIAKITQKASRAQKLHQQQNKLMIDRIRQKTKSIQQAKKRVVDLSMKQQAQKFRIYYEKNEQIERAAERSRTEYQKKLQQKRKSVKDKLQKCSENIKNLSYKQQEKFQQLENKFNKKNQPKQWKDLRLQKYKQKWQQNSRRLELEKQQKADQILQKHHQITQQNKVYKQQKDKLIQAVKYVA